MGVLGCVFGGAGVDCVGGVLEGGRRERWWWWWGLGRIWRWWGMGRG